MIYEAHHERIQAAIEDQFEGGTSCSNCGAGPGERCVFGPEELRSAIKELRCADRATEDNSEADQHIFRARSQIEAYLQRLLDERESK